MIINLLDVKIIYLIDRADLFKICDLVSGVKAIVTSLHSSLEGYRERERERRREGERERETSRTRAGVYTSCDTGNNVTAMRTDRNSVFKIWFWGPFRE
jgi:hypothetical protein